MINIFVKRPFKHFSFKIVHWLAKNIFYSKYSVKFYIFIVINSKIWVFLPRKNVIANILIC